MKKLAGMKRATTPFDIGVPAGAAKVRDAHWVEPTLVCEVAFMEWTGHGHIRHPSFQGMRADKKPRDVKREVASEPARFVSRGDRRLGTSSVDVTPGLRRLVFVDARLRAVRIWRP